MKTRISEKAKSLGFDAVGFTVPFVSSATQEGLQEFIQRGYHGDMGWLAEKADKRADPAALWPEAKSVIVVGHNYAPHENPLSKLEQKTIGNISCYAQGDDYHDVIKKKLRELASWIAQEFSCEVKLFVDTAPVMEKTLAASAGLGWQGKHTCLVSREFGSWLFLGSIFTTLSLEEIGDDRNHILPSRVREMPARSAAAYNLVREDASTDMTSKSAGRIDYCGTCTRCIDICPTQAFVGERKLDATRCIAYLTNEHKGQIPLEFRKAIGNRIYGCDDCLAVCPWNKFAEASRESAYHARAALKNPRLGELLMLDDAAFRALFRKSPVKRIGRDRFIRNVLVAAGNSGDAALAKTIEPLCSDPSSLVAEMAAWALGELENSAYNANHG
jgi:epoxyqueuosine reductase